MRVVNGQPLYSQSEYDEIVADRNDYQQQIYELNKSLPSGYFAGEDQFGTTVIITPNNGVISDRGEPRPIKEWEKEKIMNTLSRWEERGRK